MSKIRKLLVTLLTVAMSLSLTPTQADVSAKTYLNRSRLQLTVGKSANLTLKHHSKKVKWSSSNNSVASVSRTGSVKAKRSGTATITATSGGERHTCRITVKKKTISHKSAACVYVTESGSKYHRAGCRYLWHSSFKISKAQAQSRGYTACSVCSP